MISAKKDYQNIRSDREIAATLEMLEIILSKSESELLKYSKEILDSNKKQFKDWKNILTNNPQLVTSLGIGDKLVEIEKINEDLQNKRASSTKPIKEIAKSLFWRMQDLSYEPIQQQKFIYDIYAENSFDAYAENKDVIKESLLEKIEQDQKKAKKEYTSASLGEIKTSLPPSE